MGILDLGLYERGCANHGTFKNGCWACASVAENDRQNKERAREQNQRAAQRAREHTQAVIRNNGQVARQQKRQRRQFAAGVAIDVGFAVADGIARKKAKTDATLASLPRPDSAAAWLPDPLDNARLRWWDGQAWTRKIAQRPQAPIYPAGWYPDYEDPNRLRYYDGSGWTHHLCPAP